MINPETLDLSTLPSVALEAKSDLPTQSAIYFAIDSQGTIQYIGQSVNVNQRWQGHHRTKALKALGGVRIAYLTLDTDLLREVEFALIKYFNPPLNRSALEKTGIVQLIIEIDAELMQTLKDLAKQEDRTLKAFVTRALKREAAIAKSNDGVAA
jgi:excinuclease UvrABC nuclease subunit